MEHRAFNVIRPLVDKHHAQPVIRLVLDARGELKVSPLERHPEDAGSEQSYGRLVKLVIVQQPMPAGLELVRRQQRVGDLAKSAVALRDLKAFKLANQIPGLEQVRVSKCLIERR